MSHLFRRLRTVQVKQRTARRGNHPFTASRDAESGFDNEGTAGHRFLHSVAPRKGLKISGTCAFVFRVVL